MKMQNVREQIVKKVVKSGNGGAVWVPKSWLGEEVIVILPERPKLSERIVHLLEPYLKDIVFAGIYGSYARNEQESESDIDILVLTKDKKIRVGKKGKMDVSAYPVDKFKIAMEKRPVEYFQIVREMQPLINASILDDLKNIKIKEVNFKGYLVETREHLTSSSKLLGLDKEEGNYVKSMSVIYSSFLRLRGLFIMKCLLGSEVFSGQRFKEWLIQEGLSPGQFEAFQRIYRTIRDEGRAKGFSLEIADGEKLLIVLKRELEKLEAHIFGKQEKEVKKRNRVH
ncbi:nucleotidyltransferase domain-containing protein [Candidatus Woesearchaeota archaeon]|nr:nucleotidyltransferase domain-containing protein [Candidatus Woesearchaeota archaeon]